MGIFDNLDSREKENAYNAIRASQAATGDFVNSSGDTMTGNLAFTGTAGIDASASTGTLQTPTGTNTLNGDVVIAGAKTLSTGTGAHTLNGEVTVTPAAGTNAAITAKYSTPVAGATTAPLSIVASTASQAIMSISGVFISTASINLAANKTAFIIPVYHETQRVFGYLAASIGVS